MGSEYIIVRTIDGKGEFREYEIKYNLDKENTSGENRIEGADLIALGAAQNGNVALFNGAKSPENGQIEYFHHYIYLPSKDLSKSQKENLKNVLEVYSNRDPERVNNEEKLIIYRDEFSTEISLKEKSYSLEELIDLIQNDIKVTKIIIKQDSSVVEECIFKKDDEEQNAIKMSQRGDMILINEIDVTREEFCAKLYIPISLLAEDKEKDEMTEAKRKQKEFDLEIILSRLQKIYNKYRRPIQLTLYIGGDEIETKTIRNEDSKELSDSIIEMINEKITGINQIIIDSNNDRDGIGRLIICEQQDGKAISENQILVSKGNPHIIYLPKTTISIGQIRAFLELLKLCNFWQTSDNPEGESTIIADERNQIKINFSDCQTYLFLKKIIQYQKECLSNDTLER